MKGLEIFRTTMGMVMLFFAGAICVLLPPPYGAIAAAAGAMFGGWSIMDQFYSKEGKIKELEVSLNEALLRKPIKKI